MNELIDKLNPSIELLIILIIYIEYKISKKKANYQVN